MKPQAAIFGALAIAAISGTGGYLIGKNHATTTVDAGQTASATITNGKAQASGDRKGGFVKSDFKDPRPELDREQDPLKRFNLAVSRLEAWMNADPKAALAWLKSQQPSARRNEVIRMATGQFAENDPKGAAGWALANLTGAELNNALIRISEEWARQDALAAAAWLNTLPVTKQRDAAMESVFFNWASVNPSAALDYLKKTPASDELSAILRYAAFAGWAKSDPQNAVAASLESSRANSDPAQFANTLANWATMDLAGSSQWLMANVKSGGERELAVQELAGIFASQSPDAGLAWLGKLDAGAERGTALNHFASEWAAADPAAAANWAASQTIGNLTDDSVAEILHNFLSEDAPAYEAWRAKLPEGPLKEQAAKVGEIVKEQ